jgi:serine/threonine protein kinase
MLQGLNFLHGLNMVHFNVRPSNVFITQSGMVKLSEPEIPGEGAVALTDRFIKAVGYASVSRLHSKGR